MNKQKIIDNLKKHFQTIFDDAVQRHPKNSTLLANRIFDGVTDALDRLQLNDVIAWYEVEIHVPDWDITKSWVGLEYRLDVDSKTQTFVVFLDTKSDQLKKNISNYDRAMGVL